MLPPSVRPWLWAAVAGAAAWAQLLAINIPYGMFLADDALISLRYAERLAAGHGLTWNDGEYVEGYSNLAWVLLLAGWRALGGDLVNGSRYLGFACAVLALFAVAAAARPRSPSDLPATFGAPLALATASPFAIWSTAGLEQPLLAVALASSLLFMRESLDKRPSRLLGPLLAVMCLTRPDGVLLAIAAWGSWAVLRRDGVRMVGWPIGAVAAQLVFRLVYYGQWVPNTAKVKLALTPDRLWDGLTYVGHGALVLFPLAAFAFVPGERRRWLAFAPLAAWLGYVALIGGDLFPAHRHLVPALVLAAFALGDVLKTLPVTPAVGLAVAVPLGLMGLARVDEQAHRASRERWEWNGLALGEFLAETLEGRDPLLAVDSAGCVPFASGFRTIDMLGLTDGHIATQPTADFGRGLIGHDHGDGAYVLARRPDIVQFCQPRGSFRPCFASGEVMFADPAFKEEYRPVVLRLAEPLPWETILFVRAVAPAAGVRPDGDGFFVPGYLLTGAHGAAWRRDGSLVAHLPAGVTVRTPLPAAGRFRVEVDGDGVAVAGLDPDSVLTEPVLQLDAVRDARVRSVRLTRVP